MFAVTALSPSRAEEIRVVSTRSTSRRPKALALSSENIILGHDSVRSDLFNPSPLNALVPRLSDGTFDYAKPQPRGRIRRDMQMDRICKFQYKKKTLGDFPAENATAKKLVMGIDDFSAPYTIPDLDSPYFALRQWLLETCPDPQLRRWLVDTTTDSSVRLQLLQELALDKASTLLLTDAELTRWYKKESEELRCREEVIAKRKRRDDINAALRNDATLREAQRQDSFAKTAAKRKDLAEVPAVKAPPLPRMAVPVPEGVDVDAEARAATTSRGHIAYFDNMGIDSLRARSHFVRTKAINCVNVADTLFAKRGTATVAVASAGDDADVNARRLAHAQRPVAQRPHTSGGQQQQRQQQSGALWPPPIEPAVSRGRGRPQTATAKLGVAASSRRSPSPDDGDMAVSDGSEDSLAVKRGRPRPQSGTRIRDSLPVYRLPVLSGIAAGQVGQRPKTAGSVPRLRSSSPKRPPSPAVAAAVRPATAGPVMGTHRGKSFALPVARPQPQRPSSGHDGPKQDTLGKARAQLEEMFAGDIIHRLDGVMKPRGGGVKTGLHVGHHTATKTWRI